VTKPELSESKKFSLLYFSSVFTFSSDIEAGDAAMQPHPLAKILLLKLFRFEQIWLHLGKIKVKFGQIRLDLDKTWAKFEKKLPDLSKFD